MDYSVKHSKPEQIKTACLVVGVYQPRKLSPAAASLDKASGGYLSKILKKGDFTADKGASLLLYDVPKIAAQRVLLIGCGKANKLDVATCQKIHRSAAKQLLELGATEASSYLTEITLPDVDSAWHLQQAVLASADVAYRFEEVSRKNQAKKKPTLNKLTLALQQANAAQLKAAKATVKQAVAISQGVSLAKTLGNLPGNLCPPSRLAAEAKALQQRHSSVKTTVLEEAAMKKLGMGALLSVSNGSAQPAKLIVMQYLQGPKTAKPVVLVGKGITFDTGGISIKPSNEMDEMKFDMCGAASVIGTVAACAAMQVAANVIGIVASAENMPSGTATKPGDVVTSLSGQTIEILNTDAEGRLVLCDALTYAERFKPAAVIDIATLTGACVVALGHHPSGILGNQQQLIERIQQAGETSGDRVWQLPLWDEYREELKSNFADLANIGSRYGGTITAASFLSHFTENYPWAHLDIAGTAWNSGKEKGATGRPVPLLMEYIMQHHAK